jgi:uncharacterized protein (DUF433 family)
MQLEDYFEFEKFDTTPEGAPVECSAGEEPPSWDRIRVKGTRVAIEILIEEFLGGATPDQIQKNYPTVTLEEVYATITYYLHNQAEVDEYIRRGRAAAEAAYQEHLRRNPPSPLAQRLRALRAASQGSSQASP